MQDDSTGKTIPEKSKMPYLICYDCAKSKGATTVGGFTCWKGECPVCKESKLISPASDYIWPKGSGVSHIWD